MLGGGMCVCVCVCVYIYLHALTQTNAVFQISVCVFKAALPLKGRVRGLQRPVLYNFITHIKFTRL